MAGYYALLGRAPSLLDIANASGWTKQQRDQREMQQKMLDRQDEQTRYARDQSLAEFDATERHRRATEELGIKKMQNEQNAARQKTGANEQRFWANLLEKNPNDTRIITAMRNRGIDPDAMSVSLPGGEEIGARAVGDIAPSNDPGRLAMELQAGATGVLGAPKTSGKEQQVPYDEASQRVLARFNLHRGQPGFQSAWDAENAAIQREEMAKRKSGATSINVGTGTAGLETATKAKFEQDIAASDDVLSRIASIDQSIDKELVGFAGKSGEKTAAAIDYFGAPGEAVASALGMDVQSKMDFLERRQALKSQVRDVGDLVLRLRSGANAPESEVRKLESIMGGIDDMGERQLRTALKTFSESMASMRNRKANAIASGTKVAPPRRNAPTDAELGAMADQDFPEDR